MANLDYRPFAKLAADALGKRIEEVTPEEEELAKKVMFEVLYVNDGPDRVDLNSKADWEFTVGEAKRFFAKRKQ